MQPLEADDPVQLGSYRLVARLGAGGMGRVYLGRSRGGRRVALKVIRAELADNPDFRARFTREITSARAVSGAFTVAVLDADPLAPTPWLATEYVAGPSLNEALREHGPLPVPSLLALAAGLAEALSVIHRAGVIHRDLKPSNVLLAADGPRVIDFGISRAAESSELTSTGVIVGSPGFMSPEQIAGLPVTPATDVFSLGAVLSFAATGSGPFGEGPTPALLYRVVHNEPDLGGVPVAVRGLIAECLAKDPAGRPGPDALLDRLEEMETVGGHDPTVAWLPVELTGMIARVEAEAPSGGAAPAADDGGRGGGSSGGGGVTGGQVVRGFGPPPDPAGGGRITAVGAVPPPRRRPKWAAVALAVLAVAGLATGVALLLQPSSPRSPDAQNGYSSTASALSPGRTGASTASSAAGSTQARYILVPQVTGGSVIYAIRQLELAGFSRQDISVGYLCSPTGAGTVQTQSPPAGADVPGSREVRLTAVRADCTAYPDEVGRAAAYATSDLAAKGFTDVSVSELCAGGTAGLVVAQSPDPGAVDLYPASGAVVLKVQQNGCGGASPSPSSASPTPSPSTSTPENTTSSSY